MKILDVGGGVNPNKNATHVIDIQPEPKDCKLQYTEQDICNPWPFKDKEFDFIICDNVLEDIKDPIFVCNEMMRVGKAGRIVVPSILTECTKGIDSWPGNKLYAGYCHHRWLCIVNDGMIRFIPKWSIVNINDWTKKIPQEIKQKCFYDVLAWKNKFKVFEIVRITWKAYIQLLKDMFNYKVGENKNGS
jgi:ubiquinone/menaquinone biosynthesis C-methylase UbiE